MSNIIDGYCVYRCSQEIKRSTENCREMISKTSYFNRKRYFLDKTTYIGNYFYSKNFITLIANQVGLG